MGATIPSYKYIPAMYTARHDGARARRLREATHVDWHVFLTSLRRPDASVIT
jgi:hypothetical protein